MKIKEVWYVINELLDLFKILGYDVLIYLFLLNKFVNLNF